MIRSFAIIFLFFCIPMVMADDENQAEPRTRADDQAAVTYFKAALARIKSLSDIKKNSPEGPDLYMKMIETLNEIAAAQFRLSHSSPDPTQNTQDVSDYQTTLKQIIENTSYFLSKNPHSHDVPRAIFLRAKSYQELNKEPEAINDYKYLINYFPKNPNLVQAEFNLYDLLMKAKDYKTALSYMKGFVVSPDETYYPLVLDHLAFAHFYLNEISQGIQFLEQELSKYPLSPDQSQAVTLEREHILSNIALFYFTGIDNKLPEFSTAASFSFFKKLNPGPQTSKTFKYFLNLLRTKSRDEDLEIFKKAAINDQFDIQGSIAVIISAIENEFAKRQYPQIQESLQALNQIIKAHTQNKSDLHIDKVQLTLSEVANHFQERLIKNKDSPEGLQISSILIQLDQLLMTINPNPVVQQKFRFNLAETLLLIKSYRDASIQYRWIVDHFEKASKDLNIFEQSQIKSITSMYEYLNSKNLFPKELKAQAIPSQAGPDLSSELSQWIKWIDQLSSTKTASNSTNQEAIETIQFEANRLLYSQGRIIDAINRLTHFVKALPQSKHAIPSASLVLDSYIASERWTETYNLAIEFSKYIPNSQTSFRANLEEIASDSYFKISEGLYKQGKHLDALKYIDAYLKSRPHDKRNNEFLSLAAHASLAIKDKKRALTYFSSVDQKKASTEVVATTLLTRGTIAEEHYDFETAARDYKSYLTLPNLKTSLSSSEIEDLKSKTLLLAWLSGNPAILNEVLFQSHLCSNNREENCVHLNALAHLADPTKKSDRITFKNAFDASRKGDITSRTIWSAVTLENSNLSGFNDRLELINTAISGWSKLNPLYKYALIPHLSLSIPDVLHKITFQIRNISPVKLDAQVINRRVKLIEKMENTLQKVIQSPWARLRVLAFHEWANLYSNFSSDILALPKPAGLSKTDLAAYLSTVNDLQSPFIIKSNELRKKAIDLGTETGIESSLYKTLATTYIRENLTHTKELNSALQEKFNTEHIPLLINKIDLYLKPNDQSDWNKSIITSIQKHNYGKTAFLLQEAHTKKLIEEPKQALVQALSLYVAGAQAEAITELSENMKDTSEAFQLVAVPTLIQGYYGTRNLEKTKKLFESLKNYDAISEGPAVAILQALTWSGAEASSSLKKHLESKSDEFLKTHSGVKK